MGNSKEGVCPRCECRTHDEEEELGLKTAYVCAECKLIFTEAKGKFKFS